MINYEHNYEAYQLAIWKFKSFNISKLHKIKKFTKLIYKMWFWHTIYFYINDLIFEHFIAMFQFFMSKRMEDAFLILSIKLTYLFLKAWFLNNLCEKKPRSYELLTIIEQKSLVVVILLNSFYRAGFVTSPWRNRSLSNHITTFCRTVLGI